MAPPVDAPSRTTPGDQQRRPTPAEHPNTQAWQQDITLGDLKDLTARETNQRTANAQRDSADSSTTALLASSVALGSAFERKGVDKPAGQRQAGDGRNGSDQHDRSKTKDGEDKPKDRDHVAARGRFMGELAKRLSPHELKEYTARLDAMDNRMLNEHVSIKQNGKIVGEIDQKEELTKRYNKLNELAQADILKDDAGRPLCHPAHITEMIKGFIKGGEETTKTSDQGQANTCANKAKSKDAEKSVAGTNLDTIVQMVTTGQFLAEDIDGSKFICKVDRNSMRPDWQAQQAAAGRGNRRDLAGQMADLRTAQWAQALRGRQEAFDTTGNRDLGTNYYTYTDFGAQMRSRNDTGERIIDNRTHDFVRDKDGNVVMSPRIDAKLLENLTNVWYGNKISKDGDYGKLSTIGSEEAFGKQSFMTTFKNEAELVAHLQKLQSYGWGPATAATLVGNYLDGPQGLSGTAQGTHALAVELAADGKNVSVYGSWGGAHEGIKTAAEFFRWTKVPPQLPIGHPDRQRGDRIFVSDRPDVHDSGRTIRNKADENSEIGKPGDHKPGTIYEAREAEKEAERHHLDEEKKAEALKKEQIIALEELARRGEKQAT